MLPWRQGSRCLLRWRSHCRPSHRFPHCLPSIATSAAGTARSGRARRAVHQGIATDATSCAGESKSDATAAGPACAAGVSANPDAPPCSENATPRQADMVKIRTQRRSTTCNSRLHAGEAWLTSIGRKVSAFDEVLVKR